MKNAYVLGVGESIHDCPLLPDWERFGVNDIFRYAPVDHLVVVNIPFDFKRQPDRLRIIENSTPKLFHSHLPQWSYRKDYCKMKLGQPININADYVSLSTQSPFVAACLAAKMGFTNIVLYGVDMITHKHYKSNYHRTRILSDYNTLANQMQLKGQNIYVGSEYSHISKVLPLWKQ